MNDPINNGPRAPGSYPTGSRAGGTLGPARHEAGTDKAPADSKAKAAGASESNRLQAVREAIDSAPEVDSGRVRALRERIAQGDYPLDADRIAQRFADFEQLLSND